MRTALIWPILLLSVLFCGCGSQGLVTVSGTVHMDDKPLSGASVVFQPLEAGDSQALRGEAFGKTDASGRYTLRQVLSNNSGAGPGRYRVSISSGSAPIPDPLSDAAPPPGTSEPIPARYNAHSELSFEVPASGIKEADFRLTSEPGPPAATRPK